MSAETPLVSIVIPAFNQAQYLDEAIQSVLGQDYPTVELIVLDDGSTDATREVLARYRGRLQWQSHPNMGQARTLNKGWRMASGEVLGYLSADDILLPHAVSTSVRVLMQRPDIVLTYCDYNLIDAHSRILRHVRTPVFDYRAMVIRHVCPPGPGAFFRRTAFHAAGEWDTSLAQIPDYDYWLRLGIRGRFIRIDTPLAGFRIHGGSQSLKMASVTGAEEPVRVIERYFDLPDVPSALQTQKAAALCIAHMVSARAHIIGRRYRHAWRHLVAAARLHPGAACSPTSLRILANALLSRPRYAIERLFAQLGQRGGGLS